MSAKKRDAVSRGGGEVEKKEREWRLFQSFRDDYPELTGIAEASECPDILVRNDRLVGVEMTELHLVDGNLPKSERQQKSRRERVVCRAQELHMGTGGRPIELTVGFDPTWPLKNNADIEALAVGVAEVASHIQLGQPGLIDALTFEHLDCVSFLYLSGEYVNPRWKVQQSYSVPVLQVERVRQAIAGKIERAKKYQQCDAYWLLITVDFWDQSQDQEVDWPNGETVEFGPYERIFLYKSAYRRVVEVPRT
ncbi:hypothetical protein [Burkholderia pseudomallei]|uniref:hypothetical protein n=1 Tax=Burkholderia pseudomallei TaxID=28450 RepID=UPI001CC31309|nr:hypothetical protein [Burkholderia pseudomallei]